LARSGDRAPTDQRMAAVHALGHPGSPAPKTAWRSKSSQGGGSTVQPVMSTPTVMSPNVPSAPVLAQGAGSNVIVSWTPPAVDQAHGAASGFALRHGSAGSETWTIVQGVWNPYQLSDLPAAATIDVQLRATNAGGESMWSATASLTIGVTSTMPPPGLPAGTTYKLRACRRRTAALILLLRRLARWLRPALWFGRLLRLSRRGWPQR
jgi:hypothetical protein